MQTNKTLPDEIVDKLAKSRKANAGGFNLRQIILGTFDQTIHTRGEADTKALFTQTYKNIMDIEPIPNTNMPANFGHLAGGYDAQYYGYLVSFSLFFFSNLAVHFGCFSLKSMEIYPYSNQSKGK